MKPAKDAPLKRPIDEDPSPKAALQKNEQTPITGLPHFLYQVSHKLLAPYQFVNSKSPPLPLPPVRLV
jgi:hypothetical protein